MKILFISTWFPYPPDQGSKIRAYHLLRALAERNETILLSFQDTRIESAWLEHLKKLCPRIEIVARNPFSAGQAKRAMGWLSLRPSSVFATYSHEMAEKAIAIASEWHPDTIVALTFVAAPYALMGKDILAHPALVVDVDYLMAPILREAFQRSQGSLIRARRWLAWWKFRRYENWLYSQFDLSLTVTEHDKQEMLQLLDGRPQEVVVVANGVDTIYNQPGGVKPEPDTLVFNGALTYSANYEAMGFFLGRVFPSVQEHVPGVRLRITGKTDGVALDRLPMNEHVSLTGYLEDIRPTIAASWACVVPLLTGGGTRLKILEAMALGTPVISTRKGAEGLDATDGQHLLIADTPDRFAELTVRLLRESELRATLSSNARRLVQDKYEWAEIRRHVCGLVEKCQPPDRRIGA
jgi:polysaccharide biosynthesis protein PslH